ncbi:hypothetical protein CM240_1892 [Clostridium bornimense]|uniref:Uncharacterized protein n=1 Tax=Clostridium bornimense TaxID=1216932 RepID=W6SH93_9CLOT|nr:hypothetical protein CM240_1892 [Clostridium bornimense]
MKAIGNFTKNAVEEFEENIVEQKDFLEKADSRYNKNKK